MAKLPYMQFFPGDYIKDTRLLSLQARGAWMDLLCLMWDSNPRGRITNTYPSFARLFGCDDDEAKNIIDELIDTRVCDCERSCNGHVTLINRRMVKDERERELTRYRVQRHRNAKCNADCNGDSNAGVTPYIPESIIQKPKKRKESIARYDYETKAWEGLTEEMISLWSKRFPALNIKAELNKMATWLDGHKKNRKNDFDKFISNWLIRNQDSAMPVSDQKQGFSQGWQK